MGTRVQFIDPVRAQSRLDGGCIAAHDLDAVPQVGEDVVINGQQYTVQVRRWVPAVGRVDIILKRKPDPAAR